MYSRGTRLAMQPQASPGLAMIAFGSLIFPLSFTRTRTFRRAPFARHCIARFSLDVSLLFGLYWLCLL